MGVVAAAARIAAALVVAAVALAALTIWTAGVLVVWAVCTCVVPSSSPTIRNIHNRGVDAIAAMLNTTWPFSTLKTRRHTDGEDS